jgi:hypothetical protein
MTDLTPATALDVNDLLVVERARLLDTLTVLSPDEWAMSTECPAWDVKGIALHILGDDFSLLSRQRDEAVNSLVLTALDLPGADFRMLLNEFNERWVHIARFFSTPLSVWNTSTPQRSASENDGAPTGMTMNSWKSTLLSACAPPFRMFIIGVGRVFAPAPPR